ncbi:predicted protein [Nematostella vectensis]|uniref:CCHC-type domain-containing protein n=1 Tax=Nematostella vectensis TaxID=45351 RepID=A7SP19_NEMVE|nr:predicted protein [Nematostella vectensis]|eukprot:XP_001626671.1 predicted protein [Nematostella vectensis]
MVLNNASIPYSLKIDDEWCRIIHSNQQLYCMECSDFGHTRRKCPNIECRKCKERGHISFDCPKHDETTNTNEQKAPKRNTSTDEANTSAGENTEYAQNMNTEEDSELGTQNTPTLFTPTDEDETQDDEMGEESKATGQKRMHDTTTTDSDQEYTVIQDDILREWNGDIYFSNGTNSARGAAILLNPRLDNNLTQTKRDTTGRVINITIELEDQTLCITNIYAPRTDTERKQFYLNLDPYLAIKNYNIIEGDFNCITDITQAARGHHNTTEVPQNFTTARVDLPAGANISVPDVLRALKDKRQLVGASLAPGGKAIDVTFTTEEETLLATSSGLDLRGRHLELRPNSVPRTHVSVFIGISFLPDAGVDTGEVLDSYVLNKKCLKCELYLNKCDENVEEFEEWRAEHMAKGECDANFTGSSPAMEAEGAQVLWSRSIEKHKMRYVSASNFQGIC